MSKSNGKEVRSQRGKPSALYDPFADNPFTGFVEAWLVGETSADPFQNLVSFYRAEATYLEQELQRPDLAQQSKRFADRLERLIEAVRSVRLSYEEAAQISIWTHGTIRNKASDGDLQTQGGRVTIGQLAIGPEAPGLQALRAVDAQCARRAVPKSMETNGRRRSPKAKEMYQRGRLSNGRREGADLG